MKRLAVAALILTTACASQDGGSVPPPRATPDPTLAQLQVSLTELLERIDVLNHRIARLEEARTEPVRATSQPAAPQEVTRPAAVQQSPMGAARRETPSRAAEQLQPALVAAGIADEYRQGIMLFGRGSHAEARRQFEGVFEADPTGDLADNALFWIGETYYATGDYSNAIRFYNRVVNEYADQNKAPDALYKTALVQVRTGDLALARRTLQQVIERYPFSSTASAAKAELQRIRY